MTDNGFKEYLIGKMMIREENMMGYYDVILRPSDLRALRDGKVSFTEVDEELKRKCAAGTAIPTTQE